MITIPVITSAFYSLNIMELIILKEVEHTRKIDNDDLYFILGIFFTFNN